MPSLSEIYEHIQEGTMMRYGGYFYFQNLAQKDIETGVAIHRTSEYGEDILTLDGLPAGGISAQIPFRTSTNNTDHWEISLHFYDGTKVEKKQDCSYKEGNAGSTVIVQCIFCGGEHEDWGYNVIVPWPAGRVENESW